MKITMEHGSGGHATSELIGSLFAKAFDNPVLSRMEDSAVVPGAGRIAVTTDSFVVTPLLFAGGDIGRLSVCGTVNDLLMSGAAPRYLTCGFILEEGADMDELETIARSMAQTAKEAGVQIVAGDTKVVEGSGGLYINTTGVGFVPEGICISSSNCQEGDAVLVSGTLGDQSRFPGRCGASAGFWDWIPCIWEMRGNSLLCFQKIRRNARLQSCIPAGMGNMRRSSAVLRGRNRIWCCSILQLEVSVSLANCMGKGFPGSVNTDNKNSRICGEMDAGFCLPKNRSLQINRDRGRSPAGERPLSLFCSEYFHFTTLGYFNSVRRITA